MGSAVLGERTGHQQGKLSPSRGEHRVSRSPRCLRWFVWAATVAGFATVGTLNVQIKEYEAPTPPA